MILQYVSNTGIQYFVWVLQHTLVGWQKDQTVIYVRITRAEEAIKIWVGNSVPRSFKFFVNSRDATS